MATTFRYFIYDILGVLKKNEANSDITEDQVMYWTCTLANTLRQQRILKSPTGRYLNIFTSIPILTSSTSTNPNLVKNRKYIILPKPVFDIMDERGINYICHTQDGSCPPEFLNLYFQPTTPSKAQRLMYSPYETPSPRDVYFYRAHDYVYFLGLETVQPRSLEMGLYTALDLKTNLVSYDDELDLTEEHIGILRMQVLQLGSFMKAQVDDRTADATDERENPPKATPVPQTQSE